MSADRYHDAHAPHPPSFVTATWSGGLVSTSPTAMTPSVQFRCREAGELLRITGDGRLLVDGRDATDAEIAAAIRTFAQQHAARHRAQFGDRDERDHHPATDAPCGLERRTP